MKRSKLIAAVALGLLTSMTWAQAPADDAGDAEAKPVRSPEEAAVRESAKKFMTALSQGKSEEALQHFSGDAREKKFVETFATIAPKVDKFKTAVSNKFGAEAAAEVQKDDMSPERMVQELESARLKVEGDKATFMTMGEQGLTLNKKDGSWKVSSFTGDPEVTEVTGEMVVAMGGVMDKATADIDAGKYATYADAKQGMQTQLQTAMQPVMEKMMTIVMKKMQQQMQQGGATQPEGDDAPAEEAPADGGMN